MYSFHHSWEVNDGISQLSVVTICQDSRGYLWLGTRNGLNRYNGTGYTIFRHRPGDSLTIVDNSINKICEDHDNNLWIATVRGVSKMCLFTERIRNYSIADGLPDEGILSTLVDKSGRVWLGTCTGLCRYIPEKDRFVRVEFADNFRWAITALMEDEAGNIWIGTTSNGVFLCDAHMQVIAHYNSRTGLSGNQISSIYEDAAHNIWIGCQFDGLNKLDAHTHKITTYTSASSGLTSDRVRCFAEWKGELLIGTFDGVFVYRSATDRIDKVGGYDKPRRGLGHFSVYSFCLDRIGTLWIGTYGGGVTWLSSLTGRFEHHTLGMDQNLRVGTYGTACVDKQNRLWVATEGYGLLYYDITTKDGKFYPISAGHSVSSSNIIKTIYAEADCIWCGTVLGEIYRFDLATRRFSLFYRYPVEAAIFGILRDKEGNLWVGTSKAQHTLTCFTPTDERKSYFIGPKGKKLHFAPVRCMEEVSPGIFLLGTLVGLYRFDTHTGETLVYSSHSEQERYILCNYISSIQPLKYGDVYVSTYGGGFFQLDELGKIVHRVTEKEGLMGGDICKLLEGGDGKLWMSSLQGISSYSPSTGEIRNFPFENGIHLREFTVRGGVAMPDGTLCFTGNDAFLTFYSPDMPVNTFLPPVVLEDLSVSNKSVKLGDGTGILDRLLNEEKTIRLRYNQNNLSISYKALNFINPNMNRYAYKLEGYDEDWNDVGGRSTAYYTNLRPGTYLFRVKACNNDGMWNEEGKELEIVITPPLWYTWYAFLFYGLLVIGVIYGIIYYIETRRRLRERLLMEQKEKRQQEEFHQAKMHLFTNFAHELRTPLTLIITPFEELLKRLDMGTELRDKLGIIYKNAQRLLLLVNQLMDFQKNQSDTMSLQVTENNVYDFVTEIYCAFNQVAQTHNINFTLDCKDHDFRAWYDKILLEKVVFNLLSNAFKYTPEGKDISMSVRCLSGREWKEEYGKVPVSSATYLLLEVVDAGCGISPQEREKIFMPFYRVAETSGVNIPGTGIGLSLVHSIVELHKEVIRVEDRKDGQEGNRFIVLLPVSREVFAEEEIGEVREEAIADMALEQPVEGVRERTCGDIGAKRPVILLVEDDNDVRTYLYKSLKNDYEIIEATNGVKGYEKAIQHFPDLILSDIMMPKRNGLELCSMIKNDINIGHIPVILMTARSMVMHIKEGFQAGADDYIVKPFSMDVLRARIQNLLYSREQLKKLYGKRFSPEVVGVNVKSADERFSQKLYEVIERNITDQNLGIEMLCEQIGISRANLYRKIKALSELSPAELIRNKRLEVSLRYLRDTDMSVSEVATLLGFNTHSYFSNSFKSFYGFTPTEFIQMNGVDKNTVSQKISPKSVNGE
ncbi:hybrid sensor histidine kinase/response regulator transcription factor [uncultured Bacteroides sp.]|uniref:hybrid sensor histidine kinase/response regulator transcription factor n=4 Tax=uncultured Bacteroides sp. TaxID=162156 RepID=UPI0026198C8B|nr:hybrid sensor histidine kinase/response regulator transcription factor [uncultured Bacteroides sp.]